MSATITAPGVAVDYDPFDAAPLARAVPSTEAQREIWLAARLQPEASLAYNESATLRLSGPLDRRALEAALDTIVARHEALRATFSGDGESLLIANAAAPGLRHRSLAALGDAERKAEMEATLVRAVERPFDLERGPLFGAELLHLAADDHLLILGAHHIVCDGWSFGVIVRELAELYAAAREGRTPALPEADSFAAFALAAEHGAGPTAGEDEAYWLQRFANLPPPLDLPLDRPRPRRRSFGSRRIDVHLGADRIDSFRRGAARQGASLHAMLLTGFGLLLSRLTGQDDLVVGIATAGQAVAGKQALVGHAVNMLPIRMRVDPAEPFANLLARVRGDLLDAVEHQQLTFGTLLKHLALPRDPARLPLVNVLFNLDQALDPGSMDFGGLGFEFAGVPRRFENFELFVNAVQVQGALRLECQYNTDLFDAATIARWLDAYATLLDAAVADPAQETGALALLSPRERAALDALQPAPVPRAAGARLEQLVLARAAEIPARTAIRCGGAALSYAELAARVRAISTALAARGIGAGDLVGIALQRGPDLVASALGVLAAGAGYVPLDPAFPAARLAYMAEDAGLALLLAEAATNAALAWPAERTLLLDAPGALDAAASMPAPAGDEAVAYVIYTSGSTGKPKGVQVPQRAVVNFLASMLAVPGLREDDRLLAVTTLSFDIAVLELFGPLLAGGTVVLASHDDGLDGAALRRLVEAEAITLMQATPATWRLMLEAGWEGAPGFRALCGGEALPPDLAEAQLERCGEVWNLYGPTETTVWSTCWRVVAPERGISIGRPLDNTSVWILDARGQPCPIGVPGEIAIGGQGVTLGYLGRPELTAERFIPDAFSAVPGARLYRTGDRGRWNNDGLLEHQGRLDFQVKLRGFRIELGEIEANLISHPAVARAVALVREDRPGDQRLVAYLALRPGASVDVAALRAHLRQSLPDYMLPQHFVTLDAIPLLPNGKIDRKALPAPLAPADAPARTAPRTALERRIARAMEETLALPGLGIDEDFFALGGHSLLAAQLTARLAREFGVALSLRTLFDAPTVAALAEAIASQEGVAATPRIEHRADRRSAPLSLQQTRLWLFEQLHPGSVVYNTPSAHRLRGVLDEAAFARAFAALVQRQAVLRTSIGHEDGEPVQVIHDAIPLQLFPAEDLSGLAPEARESELLRRLDALVNQPFDLSVAPLFRARMFRLAPDEHVLFFMAHHAIWDGWSFDLFYEEFSALYAAFSAGHPSPLPPLAVSYGDFSAWQAEWLEGPGYEAQLDAQLDAWRERLATRGAPRPLPTDHPRAPGNATPGAGGIEWLHIARDRTQALREIGRRADATQFMTLLALCYVLLYRYVGTNQLVIGTPARVRTAPELEKVMGLFTNLLPLPLDVDPAASFLELVASVKQTVLESFAHPEVQLDDLLRAPELRAAAGPIDLYQAQFSYQDARQRIVDWGGLAQSQIPIFQRGAAEDLAVWLLEHPDGMVGGAVYNADTLERATVQRLVADFLALIDGVIADPAQSVAQLAAGLERTGRGSTASSADPTAPAADLPPASDSSLAPAAVDPDAPASAGERYLVDLWAELLGGGEVRPVDNFFDLGGHSLLAMEMVMQVERCTGVRLNLLRIASSTLRALAAALPADIPVAKPARPGLGGRLRKLFGQRSGR
ncbi:MAG: amino acid adenylation domain-containing protein [Xanthomonadales bacterium]|nr:amino acid adenylation domain-containing protein [Xanthomonadales bacterium]